MFYVKLYVHSLVDKLKHSFFLDVTQRRLVFTDVSGKPNGPKEGTVRLSQKSLTTNLSCVTSQKNKYTRSYLFLSKWSAMEDGC